MEKRTLLFVITLSLTLFLTNLFFNYMDQQSNSEWYEQQVALREKKIEQLEEKIERESVELSALPLLSYAGEKGVVLNGNFLTFAWKSSLPEQIDINGQSFTLQSPNQTYVIGEPVLYRTKDAKVLPTEDLSSLGSYELQVFLPSSSQSKAYLGRLRDGNFQLYASILEQADPEASTGPAPKGTGLAFIKGESDYIPVGIVRVEDQSLLPFRQFQTLSPFLASASSLQSSNGESNEFDGSGEQKFYVLENQKQQLVFSNVGGALSEINLTLEDETHPNSVVKEIGFDREIVQEDPQNARFPSRPYYTSGSDRKQDGQIGGYYPLIRRDVVDQSGNRFDVPPKFYSLNIVSKYPEVEQLVYKVTKFDEKSITFEARQPHRRIIKTYSLPEDETAAPYTFDLNIQVEGDSRGLWLTSGVPEVESGSVTPSLKYRVTRQNKSEVNQISLPDDELTVTSMNPDWICNSNGFLGLILDPLTPIGPGYQALHVPGSELPTRLTVIDQEYDRFPAKDYPGYEMMLPLSQSGGSMSFRVFAGPFAKPTLTTVDNTFSNAATGYNPDYISCQTFHGWFAFISEPFAKFLLILMNFFHSVTGSWALSIVLLTVALRIMLYPLNAWSMKSMMAMQKISPETQALQKKYKNDPKKLQLEIAALYRERGVNPLSGCLPMLIQMPFLIGMFDLLRSTFELRGATFIPGWIDNLAAPDVLFSWDRPIFFFGTDFHLLPVLLGVVMFFQQKISTTGPSNPDEMTEQQRQQKAMGTVLPLIFTVMFYNFPSGLNIYWMSSMLLGIAQQWWTKKRMENKQDDIEVIDPRPTKKGNRKRA